MLVYCLRKKGVNSLTVTKVKWVKEMSFSYYRTQLLGYKQTTHQLHDVHINTTKNVFLAWSVGAEFPWSL